MRLPPWLPRWDNDLTTFNAFLHAQCDAGSPTWLGIVRHPYPRHMRTVPTALKAYLLHTLQQDQCVWCGRTVTPSQATVEHVIPFASPLWPRMTPLAQLLSLRVSHQVCNQRYARLRRAAPRWATLQDLLRFRAIRRLLAHDPYWACWIPHDPQTFSSHHPPKRSRTRPRTGGMPHDAFSLPPTTPGSV